MLTYHQLLEKMMCTGISKRMFFYHQISEKTMCKIISELGRRKDTSKALSVFSFLLSQPQVSVFSSLLSQSRGACLLLPSLSVPGVASTHAHTGKHLHTLYLPLSLRTHTLYVSPSLILLSLVSSSSLSGSPASSFLLSQSQVLPPHMHTHAHTSHVCYFLLFQPRVP